MPPNPPSEASEHSGRLTCRRPALAERLFVSYLITDPKFGVLCGKVSDSNTMISNFSAVSLLVFNVGYYLSTEGDRRLATGMTAIGRSLEKET